MAALRCFPHLKLLVRGNILQTNELLVFNVAPHFVYRIVGEGMRKNEAPGSKLAQRDESEILKDWMLRDE